MRIEIYPNHKKADVAELDNREQRAIYDKVHEFVRKLGSQAKPGPVHGGLLAELRRFADGNHCTLTIRKEEGVYEEIVLTDAGAMASGADR